MKYVIIGSGFAAIGAIQGIREHDQKGKITLISNEKNYSRPLISYYLGGKVSYEALPYREEEFFEKNKEQNTYEVNEFDNLISYSIRIKK